MPPYVQGYAAVALIGTREGSIRGCASDYDEPKCISFAARAGRLPFQQRLPKTGLRDSQRDFNFFAGYTFKEQLWSEAHVDVCYFPTFPNFRRARASTMASDGWVPEIVIGVDFGMTCTGMFAFLKECILDAICQRFSVC